MNPRIALAFEETARAREAARRWRRANMAFVVMMGLWLVSGVLTRHFAPTWLSIGGLAVMFVGLGHSTRAYTRRVNELEAAMCSEYGDIWKARGDE